MFKDIFSSPDTLFPLICIIFFCLIFSQIDEDSAQCQKCGENEQECAPLWKIWYLPVGQPGREDLTLGDYITSLKKLFYSGRRSGISGPRP